jgi:hypothetical protein
MTFFRHLFDLIKMHPVAFLLFIIAVVLFLGGAVWAALRALFGLLRKVPGGDKVENAVRSASAATGS